MLGDRGNPGVGAQAGEVAVGEGPAASASRVAATPRPMPGAERRMATSDAAPGPERCPGDPQRGERSLEAAGAGRPLRVEQAELGHEQEEVSAGGLGGAGGYVGCWGLQGGPEVVGRDAADAPGAQELLEPGPSEPTGGGGGGGKLEQGREPRLVSGRAEGQRLREEAQQLLAQAIAEPGEVVEEILVEAREVAHLNDERILGRLPTEGRLIGPQGIGENEGVAAIVLGAGDGMAIAEAIELLGVEREHGEAAFEQDVDDGAAGHLDGDRDAVRVPPRPGWSARSTNSARASPVWGTDRSARRRRAGSRTVA